MGITKAFALSAILLCGLGSAPAQSIQFQAGPDFQEVQASNKVRIDLRYATTNNFTGVNLYKDFNRCYLHKLAAQKLQSAISYLNAAKPGWKLMIFDCLRPRSVQKLLWQRVVGTPQQPYVANPAGGSIHNYGFAIDLSLADENDHEIDMGTPFDSFLPLAEPAREDEFLKSGRLTSEQIGHRKILRSAMERAGFVQLMNEWWHYDAFEARVVRAKYRIVE